MSWGGCVARTVVRACAAGLIALAPTAIAMSVGSQASAALPATNVPQRPEPVPLDPGDSIVVPIARQDAFTLLTPSPAGGWKVLARLQVAGMETRLWTGYACLTGDGSTVAAVYAPAEFANTPVLRDRGGFGAMVDVATGEVHSLSTRVAIKYHTPGCGIGSDAVFSRSLGNDQAQTQLVHVDRTGTLVEQRTVAAQITSVVPTAGHMVGVAGSAIVVVDGDSSSRVLTDVAGSPFNLRAASDGGVDYQAANVADASTKVMHTSPGGDTTPVATGRLGKLRIDPGRGGRNAIVGNIALNARAQSTMRPIFRNDIPDDISLDGTLLVTRNQAADHANQGTNASARLSADNVRLNIHSSEAVDWTSAGASTDVDLALVRASANVSAPKCAVPVNDYTTQVMQPSAPQVVWASDRAIRGSLTVTRPAGWNKNGIGSSYTPSGLFPLPSGTARIPLQVIVGVLAQESNFSEASWGALPGVPGNPLVADYFGTVHDGSGHIIGMDYDQADCGYGIGQVTDHMTNGDTGYTTKQKRAIATDYAANIAASASILKQKWISLHQSPYLVTANSDDSQFIENWYFALWAYNTGINAPDAAGHYGLGWTNNPANADYNPARAPFLRSTYADAEHPNDWPYQERVLGWAETAQRDLQGASEYQPSATQLALPGYYAFCSPAVNACDRNYVNSSNPSLSYCTLSDRHCWWHGSASWPSGDSNREVSSYSSNPSAPEPTVANPHPPVCDPNSSPVDGSPGISALPAGAVTVDDLPNRQWNIVGCSALANPGSFSMSFATDASGAPLSSIDLHQIGAGYGGHFWYAHTVDPARTAVIATGTWIPPSSSSGWQRILVHIPDHGADTYQAKYAIKLSSSDTTGHFRVVNQRWNHNTWVDLGAFQLGTGASVSLSNATTSDFSSTVDVAWDAVAFVSTQKPIVSLTAVGDSYISGEGLGNYYSNSDIDDTVYSASKNKCHRSHDSWVGPVFAGLQSRASASSGNSEAHLIACSGATTENVWPSQGAPIFNGELPQLAQGWLDENTTDVLISVGGNDARFSAIVKACLNLNPPGTEDCDDGSFVLPGDTQPLTTREPQVIDSIKDRLQAILFVVHFYAPNARITLVTYPHVVTTGAMDSLNVICQAFTGDERSWMATTGDRLASRGQDAVAWGINNLDPDIYFADPRSNFANHEACTDNGEWINSASGEGSFHPNHGGIDPYKTAVLDAIPSPK